MKMRFPSCFSQGFRLPAKGWRSGQSYRRGLIQHPAAAPLDSSLRWNDDGGIVTTSRHAQHAALLNGLTPA